MKINIDKMVCTLSCPEELNSLEYFKEINVYKNIKINTRNNKIYDIENTNPKVEVSSVKVIDSKIIETMQGTSLEGQYISGKKLIIVGNINLSLILTYANRQNRNKSSKRKQIINTYLPFSTFIVIPKDISDKENVELRYLIEDTTVVKINKEQILISATILLQYLDEY